MQLCSATLESSDLVATMSALVTWGHLLVLLSRKGAKKTTFTKTQKDIIIAFYDRQTSSQIRANPSDLKLSFTLNCMLKRSNDLKCHWDEISYFFFLLFLNRITYRHVRCPFAQKEKMKKTSFIKSAPLEKWNFSSTIHRMQIWWTTLSSPGTSYMKARLVSLRCFVLKMLPKTLALSSICSALFRCACELLRFWMRREGIDRNLPPFTSKGK